MQESARIARRNSAGNEYSYERLRAEGIRLTQELSGQVWTDYNVHDPGVTILEQLCYALTDLIYRTGFDTADYLSTEESETIDFQRLALYLPESIFPSPAVTINDYRKLIFDAVPEIDNVWIHTVNDGVARGLYRIHVQLAQWVEEDEIPQVSESVIRRVEAIYAEHRNLCEDLAEVRVVPHRHYTLHGVMAVADQPDPEEILGELYFRAAQFVGGSLPYHSYAELVEWGWSLDEIFTGPRTRHVYVEDADLERTRESVTVSDIMGVIGALPGVNYVEEIWFEDESGHRLTSLPCDPALEYAPRLLLPSGDDRVGVTLQRSGRDYPVPGPEVEHAIGRRFAQYRSRRQTPQDFGDIYALPQGTFREFNSYYSVQHHFPNTYGINQYGLPEATPPRRKSQANNLKAYLLFFEQLLANFLQNLQEIPRLFSRDPHLRQSYFYQELDNQNVPNVMELYQHEVGGESGRLASLLAQYDNFGDRRNRVLDYLLGLYGQTFSPEYLYRREVYGDYLREDVLIQSKLELLRLVGAAE